MIEKRLKDEYKIGTRKGITELDECFYIPVRITGSGLNQRLDNEGKPIIADRQKADFFSAEAMEHYKTLPILLEHPKDDMLNSDNLKENAIIGNCIDAWQKGDDEVWGLARIFDKTLLKKIKNKEINSTSPAILIFYAIMSGEKKDEVPISINHLAFVEKGHWDIGDSLGFDDSAYELISLKEQTEQEKTERKNTMEVSKLQDAENEVKTADGGAETLGEIKPDAEEVNLKADEGKVEFKASDKEMKDFDALADDDDEPTKDAEEVEEKADEEVKEIDEVEEVEAKDAETELIDSETEGEEDKAKDEALTQMRKACDSAHSSLNVKMPHIEGRQTQRSVINRFLNANRAFVNPKYAKLALDSFTNELASEVLKDTCENIAKKSQEIIGKVRVNGFVNTGKGYLVNSEFGAV